MQAFETGQGGPSRGQVKADPTLWETCNLYFTGKERDDDTRLDYFGARNYANTSGRFASPDPISLHPERLNNPQRLNLYVYCRNNPLRFIDPAGLDDYEYDEQGRPKIRKRGFWHNLFRGHTYTLTTSSGQRFKLEGPLGELKSGEETVLSEKQTMQAMDGFLEGKERRSGQPRAGVLEVLANSPEERAWDFKNAAGFDPVRTLFQVGDTAYRADYIGNALWGAIMGSHGWPELVSKAGAGAYQLLRAAGGNVRPGPFWSFYDDPRDTEAMLVSKSRAVPELEGCGWPTKTTWKVIPRCLYRREASQAVTTLEIPTLDTPRLRLRAFTESDFPAYRILVADPQVMRFLGDGRPLSDIDAWRQLATIVGHWALRGFGLWAVEERATKIPGSRRRGGRIMFQGRAERDCRPPTNRSAEHLLRESGK